MQQTNNCENFRFSTLQYLKITKPPLFACLRPVDYDYDLYDRRSYPSRFLSAGRFYHAQLSKGIIKNRAEDP